MEIELLEQAAIYAVLIPGIPAALALLFAPGRVQPFALALAYFIGDTAVRGWPGLPPADSTQWLPWIALLAGLLGSVSRSDRKQQGQPRFLDLATLSLMALALALILIPAFRFAWEPLEGAGLLGLLLLGSSIFWFGIRNGKLVEEMPAIRTVLLLTTGIGVSILTGIAGSVVLAQAVAVVATLLAADLAIAWVGRKAPTTNTQPLYAVLLAAFFVAAWYFAEAPATAGLILASVPWLAIHIPGKFGLHRSTKTAQIVALVIALALTATACYLTISASPPLDMEF